MGFMDKMKDLVGITDEYDDDYDNISQEEIDAPDLLQLDRVILRQFVPGVHKEQQLRLQSQLLRNRLSARVSARWHSTRWHRRTSTPKTRNRWTSLRAMTLARSEW